LGRSWDHHFGHSASLLVHLAAQPKNHPFREEHSGQCKIWACLEKTDTNSGGFDVV
jgi:hypothetical protein